LDQEPLSSLHLHDLESVIKLLKKKYPFIIIDPGASDLGLLQMIVTHSSTVVLLGGLDIPSLKGLTIMHQKITRWGCLPHQIKLVLNRFNAKNQLGVTAFEKNIGQKVAMMLPNQYALCIESVNTGKSLFQLDSRAELTRKIFELSQMLENAETSMTASTNQSGKFTNKIADLLSGGKGKKESS
jgi:Flp pilus assembly CpaE family ATPase